LLKANLELFRKECIDTLELPETCFPIIRQRREIFLEENFTSPATGENEESVKLPFWSLQTVLARSSWNAKTCAA
jgi:hypothetical protein